MVASVDLDQTLIEVVQTCRWINGTLCILCTPATCIEVVAWINQILCLLCTAVHYIEAKLWINGTFWKLCVSAKHLAKYIYILWKYCKEEWRHRGSNCRQKEDWDWWLALVPPRALHHTGFATGLAGTHATCNLPRVLLGVFLDYSYFPLYVRINSYCTDVGATVSGDSIVLPGNCLLCRNVRMFICSI